MVVQSAALEMDSNETMQTIPHCGPRQGLTETLSEKKSVDDVPDELLLFIFTLLPASSLANAAGKLPTSWIATLKSYTLYLKTCFGPGAVLTEIG